MAFACSACGDKHEAWRGRLHRGARTRDSRASETSRRLPLSHHARHRLWRHFRSAAATWHNCNHVTSLCHVTCGRRRWLMILLAAVYDPVTGSAVIKYFLFNHIFNQFLRNLLGRRTVKCMVTEICIFIWIPVCSIRHHYMIFGTIYHQTRTSNFKLFFCSYFNK